MVYDDHIRRYVVDRGVTPATAEYFRRISRVYVEADGPWPPSSTTINEFLHRKSGSPDYLRSLRAGLSAIARYLAEIGETSPVGRIAVVRSPKKPVRTWTAEEIGRLRDAAAMLSGVFDVTGQSRSEYFSTMIAAAWYLGLSQVDIHRLKLDDFRDGNIVISRQKTGVMVQVGLPPEAWHDVLHFAQTTNGELIWPLWGSREIFARTFRRIVVASGLSGSWKTLRASAGTAYELTHPGMGHLFLGNTRDVFMRNYYDARQEPGSLPHAPLLPVKMCSRKHQKLS